MCYVCSCFAFTLDLFQRILTFILSCWLVTAICCGLTIAVCAGIAYGYNYSLAEFITLTRADVRVYMRRGQFYDRPDLVQYRRKMGDDDEGFPGNLTNDYQEQFLSNDAPLSEQWSKNQDTRKYAEKLTKYSDTKRIMADSVVQYETPNYYKFTSAPTHYISIIPNPIISTTVWQSGSSQIIMRQFEPINEIFSDKKRIKGDEYRKKVHSQLDTNSIEEIERPTQPISPDIRIIVEDNPKSEEYKLRDWKPSPRPVIPEYLTQDMDEDAVVYKTV
ncbi:uncharacterized protein LOC119830974 [Zerene cesonia]|uniref:uncharacterized protein LOC119830974 n=1 Tax=Zerene cesonia TaxID=33412 RepID=UPI0018E51C0F|nr:uncharacterized protein LOC119830974 [Zerene cesonia]